MRLVICKSFFFFPFLSFFWVIYMIGWCTLGMSMLHAEKVPHEAQPSSPANNFINNMDCLFIFSITWEGASSVLIGHPYSDGATITIICLITLASLHNLSFPSQGYFQGLSATRKQKIFSDSAIHIISISKNFIF